MSDLFIPLEQAERDLLAGAAFIAERIRSSDGHAEAMASIIPHYLEKGEVDLSAELANAIGDPHSRDRLLSLVAEKCARINDDEYAIQLAEAIEDHGLQSEVFERLGAVKASQGNTSAALEIAELMNHPDFVYAAVAVDQAARGDGEGAFDTLSKIEFHTALCTGIQSIAAGHIDKEEFDTAVKWLDQAIDAADEIEHTEERIRSLAEIGNQFIEAKRNDRAIQVFDRARGYAEASESGQKDFLLVTAAIGFLHAGEAELADDTLDLVHDTTQMASALTAFARDAWQREDKDDALETLEEAYAIINSQRDKEIRDSRARNAVMASIAAQFAAFGRAERGVEIARNNPDPQQTVAALTQIVQLLTLQKNDQAARDTMLEIEDESSRVSALIVMSDAKKRIDDSEGAIALLDEASSLAETVPQFVGRSALLNDISRRYARHDRKEKVRELAVQNLQAIREIRDESSRAAAMASLSQVYAEAGISPGEAELSILEMIVRTA